MPSYREHFDAVISAQCAKLRAAPEGDRSSAVPDTAGGEYLCRWGRDTEPQVLRKIDDGLRQLAVARLKQLVEKAHSLLDGNLEYVADHLGVNSQHRVKLDPCPSSQLDHRLAIYPSLQH